MACDAVLSASALLYRDYMHKLLKQGGMKVLVTKADGTSSTEIVDFSPAMIRAFEAYLHHWGMSSTKPLDAATGGNGADPAETFDRIRSRGKLKLAGGGKLPPLSEKPDAATG